MNGEVTSLHLPAPRLAQANAAISSLFQALNLIMTGRKEKCFFPFLQVLCRQGWSWVSKSAFFHCRHAYLDPARKNRMWHLWFHLAETVWWASASGFSPSVLLLFFFLDAACRWLEEYRKEGCLRSLESCFYLFIFVHVAQHAGS